MSEPTMPPQTALSTPPPTPNNHPYAPALPVPSLVFSTTSSSSRETV